MIKQDNLYTRQEARERLMNGVKKASEAVAITMGTAGSNSLIECIERPGHYSTNDGATILGSIKFADPIEEMGRMVLFEAVSRANKSSGDGSSTTCVLTSAILEEGMKHIGEKNPMEIKRSLEECIPIIEKSIDSQKKEIDVDSVAQVASISAEDESIGNKIQEIYQKIGKEGIIQWDISKTPEDSYTIGTGLSVEGTSLVSPYMANVDETGRFLNASRLINPLVLLCKQKITSAQDFGNLFYSLNEKNKKEVVVFCDEIEFPAIADLVKTRIERGFRAIVVKMPIIYRDEWWEDLSLATGAKIVDGAILNLSKVQEEDLGIVEHLTITKEETYIDGIKDLKKHILALQVDGSDEALQRAGRLNLKTARYFVGAQSESALAYKRLKVEDAINAANCALEHGIVPGGGIALLNSAKELPLTIGGRILKNALIKPFRQIMTNAGKPDATIKGNSKFLGFNSHTMEIGNMFDMGIVDPTDVVLNAAKNAIGVAASILTMGTVVTLPREEMTINTPTSIIPR